MFRWENQAFRSAMRQGVFPSFILISPCFLRVREVESITFNSVAEVLYICIFLLKITATYTFALRNNYWEKYKNLLKRRRVAFIRYGILILLDCFSSEAGWGKKVLQL